MSDIQEEQKRLYKKAEKIDKEQEINNKFARIVRDKMNGKSAVEMIVLQDEEINELQDRIDKAIEYIRKYGYEKQMEEDYLMNRVNLANYNCLLLDILKGDN